MSAQISVPFCLVHGRSFERIPVASSQPLRWINWCRMCHAQGKTFTVVPFKTRGT